MNPNSPLVQVSHIGDYNQVVPDEMLLVENDADYVVACHRLRDLLGSSESARIWVRHESHFQWLRSFVEQTRIDAAFDRKTPRRILAERWGVSIPDWLDDQTVLSQDLLGMVVSAENTVSFEETMLVTCVGAALASPALSSDNLSGIISAVTQPKACRQIDKYPVLARCLQEKCQAWSKDVRLHWTAGACKAIAGNCDEFWRELTLWALLAGYPTTLLEYVVSPEKVGFLQSIPLEAVQGAPLHPVATEQAWSQIEMFFNDVAPSVADAEAFSKILERVSGRIAREFRRVVALMESGQVRLSDVCVDQVKRVFKACPGVNSAALDSLGRFVRPARPSLLGDGAERGADDWIAWTVNEYIPYRHWQTLNNRYDPEVEEEVQWFSDWYTNEYATVHQDDALSLVHVLTQWQDTIQADALSVILLVDCMPLAHWHLLEKALTRSGFYRHRMDHRFAPLPTDTRHAKPLLISGNWQSQDQTYENLLQHRSEADWPGKQFRYLPNLKAMANMESPHDGTVLLLNLLSADEALHSDVTAAGSTHDEELHRLFSRLADVVKSLMERWGGQPDALGLYVVTDHGAAMILEEERSSLDAKTVDKLFPDSRHRFAYVTASEADSIPENLWNLGYRFRQPFSSQDSVYFIPRGHSTVRTTSSSHTYVHGGASPEEVIVPAAEFRPVATEWKEPAWRFLDLPLGKDNRPEFYVCRVIRLQIEIQNQNSEPLCISNLEILGPVTDLKGCTTPVIEPMSSGMIDCDCYFAKQAVSDDHLAIQLLYEIAGQERVHDIILPATFRSAVTGGFSLKDI